MWGKRVTTNKRGLLKKGLQIMKGTNCDGGAAPQPSSDKGKKTGCGKGGDGKELKRSKHAWPDQKDEVAGRKPVERSLKTRGKWDGEKGDCGRDIIKICEKEERPLTV